MGRSPRGWDEGRDGCQDGCQDEGWDSSPALVHPRYRIEQKIGSGGFAEVFRGTQIGARGFERPVAIKRARLDRVRDGSLETPGLTPPELTPRSADLTPYGSLDATPLDTTPGWMGPGALGREAMLTARLHHGNIAAVLDHDRDAEGRSFVVMELVDGVNLARLMDTGPVPVSIALDIAAAMLRGLAHAHAPRDGMPGVLHCDLSPHNVMLGWSGAIKLVDFGVGQYGAGQRGPAALGKPGYTSPEQVHGVELDGRADQFSAGVILHELLSGRRLFAGRDRDDTVRRVLCKTIPSPALHRAEVGDDVAGVCMRMLARDRRMRYPGCGEALAALIACAGIAPPAGHDSAGLADLLARRFTDIAPPRPATRMILSARSVPRIPSEVMIGDDSVADALMNARTRSIPSGGTARDPVPGSRPGPDPRSGSTPPGPRRSLVYFLGGFLASLAAAALALAVVSALG